MNFQTLPDPAFCYHLTVPLGQREWITSNRRLYWRRQAQLTKAWRQAAFVAGRTSGIRRIERAWLVADLAFSENRRRDPANWHPTAKACVDGLVDAGLFADDDDKHIIGPDMRINPDVVAKPDRGLTFLIYPLEGSQ